MLRNRLKYLALIVCILAIPITSFAENWPNFMRGGTLVKDGQFQVLNGTSTIKQALKVDGALVYGTDTVTMTAANPGVGAITPSASSDISYYVISDATGANADQLDLGDGVFTGQQIRITLQVDGETTGLNIVPATKLVGTSTLLETVGDVVTYEWSGAGGWSVVGNIGGTEL